MGLIYSWIPISSYVWVLIGNFQITQHKTIWIPNLESGNCYKFPFCFPWKSHFWRRFPILGYCRIPKNGNLQYPTRWTLGTVSHSQFRQCLGFSWDYFRNPLMSHLITIIGICHFFLWKPSKTTYDRLREFSEYRIDSLLLWRPLINFNFWDRVTRFVPLSCTEWKFSYFTWKCN